MVLRMTLFEVQTIFSIRNFVSCVSITNKICVGFEVWIAMVEEIKVAYLQVTQPVLALGLLALGFFLL